MEAQLEIVCKHPPESCAIPQRVSSRNGSLRSAGSNNSQASNQWYFLQSFCNKLKELFPEKPYHGHKYVDDDWDVPFERIRISHGDFQRGGSQGDVFYGKLTENSVAVKRVRDVTLTNIRHLRDLNHKNIIKFYGVSQNSNYYYIIMEWCPFGTLHEHIHNGRQLPSTLLSNFSQQIASGMKYLHSKNIIHRDLKPSNILLTHNDVLKISDFGTHKVFDSNLPMDSITYAGTHAYMAPEVIRSEPHSFPVDVWSYGVVLWEVLTGDEPYKNLVRSAVVWAVGNNSFRLPIPDSFPEGFRRVLDGCWKAQPEKRLTFQQICMILRGAVQEVSKISKERWLPMQAEWKRTIRDELNKKLLLNANESSEDSQCHQKRQSLEVALEQALEQAQKRRNKNNDLYLKLQECCMHLDRERLEVSKREEAVSNREMMVAKRESDFSNQTLEINRLRELFTMIKKELNQRGIVLECLQSTRV